MPHFDLAIAVTYYVVFVYSTVCHEAAHAWSALKLGDRTAYEGGQVSLDPIPHIRREPFGMVLVPIVSLLVSGGLFGWASAPLNAEWVMRNPRRAAWVALAGPAANFILCLLAVLLMFIGLKAGVFTPPHAYMSSTGIVAGEGGWAIGAQVLSIMFSLNLLLGVFNLLPAPPLDGSNIPLLWLDGRTAEKYQLAIRQPQLQILTFIIAWNVAPLIIGPVFQWAFGVLRHLYF
jgi:Zn-dependent protease